MYIIYYIAMNTRYIYIYQYIYIDMTWMDRDMDG